MHFLLLLVALLSALASATAAPAAPSRRAAWNDQYIKEPVDFRLQRIGGCAYQLTFRRDTYDSRYAFSFEARYPTGSRTITPVEDRSNLAISRAGPTGTIPPYTLDFAPYTLSVLPFANACDAQGRLPSSLIVKARLQGGYTYRNDWDSPAIAPVSGAVPGVPGNVRVASSTASWSPVSGATSYFVLTQFPTYASELGTSIPAYQTKEVTGTSVGVRSNTQRIAVVAKIGSSLSDVKSVRTVTL